MAEQHKILISVPEHDQFLDVKTEILGCSCGWKVPSGMDPDDAIALHITMAHQTTPAVSPRTMLALTNKPEPGLYRHYKGHLYCVLGCALLEETLTPAVVYTRDEIWWIRTVEDFTAEVIDSNGIRVPRFRKES